jgi:proline iminopeptidase
VVIGSQIYYPRTFSNRFKQEFRCAYVDYRVFVPDAPQPGGRPYGVAAAADEVEAMRQRLGLEDFVLFGHSIGGLIVLAYAQQHPGLASHVVAIGAPPEWTSRVTGSVGPFWEAHASAGRKAAHVRNLERLTAQELEALSPSDRFIAQYVANAARYWADSTYDGSWLWQGTHVNMARVDELFDLSRPFAWDATTGRVSTPVLVMLGSLDFAVPVTLWDGFDGPFDDMTVHVFDHAGHTPQLEVADEFDTRLMDWLRQRGREQLPARSS